MRIKFTLYIQNKNIVNGVERDESPDATTPFPSQMEVNWVRYYQQHPYVNITIPNYAQHPIEHELYNVIAGKNVVIDCDYIIPNNECLTVLAENCIQLKPGFYAENGSTLRIKADRNLFEEVQKGQRGSDTKKANSDYEAIDEIVDDVDDCNLVIDNIKDEQENKLPSITPNPSKGIIQLKMETNGDCYDIYVFDLFGRQVYAKKYLTVTNSLLNLSTLSKGIYIVRMFNHSSQQQYIRKLIIQ